MEESEKRRERLRAMRAEAAEAENIETPAMPCHLSNPLTETSAAMPLQEQPFVTSRFDFYTDPMSAFSANKKRNKTGDQIYSDSTAPPFNSGPSMLRFPSPRPGPRSAEMTPSPHQYQSNYSPDQSMYQARGFGHNISQRSPIGISRPFSMHQGNLNTSIDSVSAMSYNFPTGRFPSPGYGPTGSPFNAGQGRAHRFSNSPSPSSGHGGSPSRSSGRGGSHWHGSSSSPGPGRRGGRGLGYSGRPMNRPPEPERFYDDSMIEDPWKFLKPVIWKEVNFLSSRDASKSWIPRAFEKKAKVSGASDQSNSQPSLAEYLAASFKEAVGDGPSM